MVNNRNVLGVGSTGFYLLLAKFNLLAAVKTPLGSLIFSGSARITGAALALVWRLLTPTCAPAGRSKHASTPNIRHTGVNNRLACGAAINNSIISGCANIARRCKPNPAASCAAIRTSQANPPGQSRTTRVLAALSPTPSLTACPDLAIRRTGNPCANRAANRSN